MGKGKATPSKPDGAAEGAEEGKRPRLTMNEQHQHQHQHQLDENAFELLLEPDKDLDELVQEAAPAPLRAAAGVAPAALSGGASAAASREAEAEQLRSTRACRWAGRCAAPRPCARAVPEQARTRCARAARARVPPPYPSLPLH